MKTSILLLALALTGCGVSRQNILIVSRDTNGVVSSTRLRSTVYTIWDAASTVERARLSAGKVPAIGLAGIDTASSGSNAVAILHEISTIVQALPK